MAAIRIERILDSVGKYSGHDRSVGGAAESKVSEEYFFQVAPRFRPGLLRVRAQVDLQREIHADPQEMLEFQMLVRALRLLSFCPRQAVFEVLQAKLARGRRIFQ